LALLAATIQGEATERINQRGNARGMRSNLRQPKPGRNLMVDSVYSFYVDSQSAPPKEKDVDIVTGAESSVETSNPNALQDVGGAGENFVPVEAAEDVEDNLDDTKDIEDENNGNVDEVVAGDGNAGELETSTTENANNNGQNQKGEEEEEAAEFTGDSNPDSDRENGPENNLVSQESQPGKEDNANVGQDGGNESNNNADSDRDNKDADPGVDDDAPGEPNEEGIVENSTQQPQKDNEEGDFNKDTDIIGQEQRPVEVPTTSPGDSVSQTPVDSENIGLEPENNREEDNSYWEIANETEESYVAVQAEEDGSTVAPAGEFTDEDNFVPVPEISEYYYTDLQPFSVFVEADRDLTSDLGIPLFMLLEMAKKYRNIENVHISNMTIHTGIVRTDSESHSNGEDHYHWNKLIFEGAAEFDNSEVYSPAQVQSTQSLILSNPENLQAFWKNEGDEVYQNLELVNITLMSLPTPPLSGTGDDDKQEGIEPTMAPVGQQWQQQLENETTAGEDSNVWIMVTLVVVFIGLCLCIICFAGRLRYLESRAQERYNEKYGLDYNIYDKDISKDIFKEEYLMSEHGEDHLYNQGGAGFGDSFSSLEHSSRSIPSVKAVAKSSDIKKIPIAGTDDTKPTEEENLNGSSSDSREIFANEGSGREPNQLSASFSRLSFSSRSRRSKRGSFAEAMSSSSRRSRGSRKVSREDGSFPSNPATENMSVPPPMIPMEAAAGEKEKFEDENFESSASSSNTDHGDILPELAVMSNSSARGDRSSSSLRHSEPILSGALTDNEEVIMGNPSLRSALSIGSIGSAGKDGIMGNMSGRSSRSTRSQRSFSSFPSDSSFYSAQGDMA